MGEEKLSSGVLLSIMKNEKPEDPIVQILQHKRITAGDKTRYRLLLSDGKYQISNAMYTGAEVENFSIVKLKRYNMSELNSGKMNKVLIIITLEILVSGPIDPIGNPENLTTEMVAKMSSGTKPPPSVVSTTSFPAKPREMKPDLNQSLSDSKMISVIAALTPYHNKWVIKARVANKSQMRSWSNSKGEGKLFSVDLMDESGEIRCTAFRDLAEKYYDYLQVDKVYYFSKCQLKPTNRQFNTLKNDYELTVGNETVIEECLEDDGAVPKVQYNFVPISSIKDKVPGNIVDVLGICKEATDVQTFTSKTTNRELQKRDVVLIDQSQTSITLTLWGKEAEAFDGSNNPVVLIRGAKVGEFGGGKTLSTLMSSQLKINPDIPECHKIKGWFDLQGHQANIKNLSERTSSGNFLTPWMTLEQVQKEGLGNSERGDYFQTMATILLIRSENAVYKACPTEECNKKVVDLENGMYRCEKCNREFPNFKYRLLISMNIADFSGNYWVSTFAEEGEKILGKTSQEVGLALEEGVETAASIFQEANFKQFVFKCRAKIETYNDEQRLRIVVINVENVSEKHITCLCEGIGELSGISC